jgi:hypothetical protein
MERASAYSENIHGLEKPKLTVNGGFLRVGSIYSLKEKAQTSMEQDGSGCIGVVATRGFSDQCCFLSNDLEVFKFLTQTRNVA